jgi:hypothetical protein
VIVATPAAITVLLLTQGLPPLAPFVAGLATFVIVGSATYLVAFRSGTRRALEVFAWLGGA